MTPYPMIMLHAPGSAAATPIVPTRGYKVLAHNGRPSPGFHVQGALCILSGSVQQDMSVAVNRSPVVGVLPPSCRPAHGALAFAASRFTSVQRVDVSVHHVTL